MKHEFAILPWEYRGSGFDTAPHAFASLSVGGQERDFLLKMRDGIIYFKEPKRPQVFAVLREFEKEMRGEDLIEAWRKEMKRENFGRILWRLPYFSETLATTLVVSISRPDFSGWISDAFHIKWLQTPKGRIRKKRDVWNLDVSNAAAHAIVQAAKPLFDRALPVGDRQPIRPRWFLGNEAELRRVFALVMPLYSRYQGEEAFETWEYRATNPISPGGFIENLEAMYQPEFSFSSGFSPLLRLLEQHFAWEGMEWEHIERNYVFSDRFKEMASKWGEDWRGNYNPLTPCIQLTVPLTPISYHQRLEFSLELRDWLKGKVSPRQSANLLAKAFA